MTTLLLKYWKFALIIILSVLSFLSIKSCISNRNEKVRYESNYNTVVNDKQQAEILHNGELAIYHKDIDSLGNAIGIRDKTIQSIWQTVINYKAQLNIKVNKRDTGYYYVPVPKDSILYTNITLPRYFTEHKPCYDINFYATDDSLGATVDYHNQFTGFIHWERPHKFWFIHWGAKQYFMKLYSDCQKDTIRVDKLILMQ